MKEVLAAAPEVSRRAVVAAIAGLLPVRAFAADAVEPRDEPHHHLIAESPELRVFRVLIAPGDSTAWHRHTHDFCVTEIRGARLRSDVEGQGATESDRPTDSIEFTAYEGRPAVHRVTNESTWLNHQLAFELLRPGPGGVAATDRPAPFEPMLDNQRLRAWRLRLPPGAFTPPVTLAGPGLRILLAGERLIEAAPGQVGREIAVQRGAAEILGAGTRVLANGGGALVDLIEFAVR